MISSIEKRKRTSMDKSTKPILRPRTAYNFFCKYQRDIILNEKLMIKNENSLKNFVDTVACGTPKELRSHRKAQGLICFKQLTKIVAKRWKAASPETRKKFKKIAESDKVRYTRALTQGLSSKHINGNRMFQSSQGFNQEENHFVSNESKSCYQQPSGFQKSDKSVDYLASFQGSIGITDCYFDKNPSKSKYIHNSSFTDTLGISWSKEELNLLKCFSK